MFKFVLFLVLESILFLFSLLPFRSCKRDHFAPHLSAPFEGYYTRIVTATATIIIIISSVRKTKDRPHYVHFSYLPRASPTRPAPSTQKLRVDVFPPKITEFLGPRVDGVQQFTCKLSDDMGEFSVLSDSQIYDLRLPTPHGQINVHITLKDRTPWDGTSPESSPEGALANLRQLPLHWHVFSTNSVAAYTITAPEFRQSGVGSAHMEKNWGESFPPGWTWVQALSATKPNFTLTVAGGRILSQKAYLVGYSSPNLPEHISFAPPTSLMPFGYSTPFISEKFNSRAGTLELTVSGWKYRLRIRAQGPAEHADWSSFFCPIADARWSLLAFETFEAVVAVTVEQRVGWGQWKVLEEVEMKHAALEFGGDYSFKVRRLQKEEARKLKRGGRIQH